MVVIDRQQVKFWQTSGGNVATIHSIQSRCVGSLPGPMSSRWAQSTTPGGISSVASSSTTSIDLKTGHDVPGPVDHLLQILGLTEPVEEGSGLG